MQYVITSNNISTVQEGTDHSKILESIIIIIYFNRNNFSVIIVTVINIIQQL